jgi:L-seryl-tRNA(Ser) seleniumtransferase
MNIYERYGVSPILNFDGPLTRYGGAIMEQETLDAMDEAAKHTVPIDRLQAAASKVIARVTHAEAGIVTSGAFSALTLATAACMCGFDVARMDRLPDSSDMPNEVIMPSHQISGYAHSFRAAGAKLVAAGIPHAPIAPMSVYRIDKWHIEAAITERTVAIAYAARTDSHPELEDVIGVGESHGIPVIVDAGPEVPPLENLHKFIDMGADLVCISGGKGIRGPQNSGILCGRSDLIASAAAQMLEAPSEHYPDWNPPESLMPKEKFRSTPSHGIGRGMKVSKETIVGLLTALGNISPEKFAAKERAMTALLEKVAACVTRFPGFSAAFVPSEYCLCEYPTLELTLDDRAGIGAARLCAEMRERNIFLRDRYVTENKIRVYSMNMNPENTDILCAAFSEILGKSRA